MEIVERALIWDLVGLASIRSAKRQTIFCACDGRYTTMVGSCSFRLSQGGRNTNLHTPMRSTMLKRKSETWC